MRNKAKSRMASSQGSDAENTRSIREARGYGQSLAIASGAIDAVMQGFEEEVRARRLEGIRRPFAAMHSSEAIGSAVVDALIRRESKEDDWCFDEDRGDEEPEPVRPDYHAPKMGKT